jgi:hypothetical protein
MALLDSQSLPLLMRKRCHRIELEPSKGVADSPREAYEEGGECAGDKRHLVRCRLPGKN